MDFEIDRQIMYNNDVHNSMKKKLQTKQSSNNEYKQKY